MAMGRSKFVKTPDSLQDVYAFVVALIVLLLALWSVHPGLPWALIAYEFLESYRSDEEVR